MKRRIKQLALPMVDRLARTLVRRWENGAGLPLTALATRDGRRFPDLYWGLNKRVDELTKQVTDLRDEIVECRRLNQRLADVLDVVTEVLVPAVDRDDARIREVLERLDRTVNVEAPRPEAAPASDVTDDGGEGGAGGDTR